MPLNDAFIRSLKPEGKTYKRFDGGGLYIEVTPKGYKSWNMKYSVRKLKDGKYQTVYDKMKFGTYPSLSLKEAREKREEIRKILDAGNDPKIEKEVQENEFLKQTITFNEVGLEWWKDWRQNKAKNTRKNRKRQLKPFRNAFGKKPLVTITRQTIRETLELLLETGKVESVKRGFWMVRSIFEHAIMMGYCDNNPAQCLNNKFKNILTKTRHHPAITDKAEFGKFLNKIADCNSSPGVKLCLLIMAYLPLRSTELRGAKWTEIDFNNAEWIVPGTRAKDERDGGGMKNRQPHRVPLSKQVLRLFKQLKVYTGDGEYCFPGKKNNKNITPQALTNVVKRQGYKGKMCAHGFRSSFTTFCNEYKTEWGFSKDEIEYQLAHSETDQIREAYNLAEYFDIRRKLMQKWADFLDELRKNNS